MADDDVDAAKDAPRIRSVDGFSVDGGKLATKTYSQSQNSPWKMANSEQSTSKIPQRSDVIIRRLTTQKAAFRHVTSAATALQSLVEAIPGPVHGLTPRLQGRRIGAMHGADGATESNWGLACVLALRLNQVNLFNHFLIDSSKVVHARLPAVATVRHNTLTLGSRAYKC
ncbi:hypothetical protein Bbelb_213840 [Branchiostoma belcheri]|nr:hypothetical protein Bbelb_213840 [Branchiostoma belcheri]